MRGRQGWGRGPKYIFKPGFPRGGFFVSVMMRQMMTRWMLARQMMMMQMGLL